MEIGNSWTYTKTIEYISSSGDSIPAFIASQFDTHTVTVLVDRTEILNGSLSTYVVKTRDGFSTDFSENYYIIKKDGLYHVAYKNVGFSSIAFPKSSQRSLIKFKKKSFSNMDELLSSLSIDLNPGLYKVANDSLIFETEPLQTLKYPLTIESFWTYREKDRMLMAKTVLDEKTIQVLDERFLCFEIKWLYDWDNNKAWDDDIFIIDYVSDAGLMKRTIYILGIVYTDQMGNELGTFDYIETFTLSGYTIFDPGT